MNKLLSLSICCVVLALKTSVVLADPLCWLRSTSPLDDAVEGPIQLDRDWKVYKLVKPFRVSPHVYSVELLLSQTEYDLFDIGESGKNAKAWIGLVPRNKKIKQIITLMLKRVTANLVGSLCCPPRQAFPFLTGSHLQLLATETIQKNYKAFIQPAA